METLSLPGPVTARQARCADGQTKLEPEEEGGAGKQPPKQMLPA